MLILRHTKPRQLLALVPILIFTGSALGVAVSRANNFGEFATPNWWIPQDTNHSIRLVSVDNDNLEDGLTFAVDHLLDPLSNFSASHSWGSICDGVSDVCAYDGDYSSQFPNCGMTTCLFSAGWNGTHWECSNANGWSLILNTGSGCPLDFDSASYIACHEAGHTVGLTHRTTDNSCMRSSFAADPWYKTHDKNHIKNDI